MRVRKSGQVPVTRLGKVKQLEQRNDYRDATFTSALGLAFAGLQCLGRKHDAYSIYIFHAAVNLEASPSSRQNKFTPAQIS